jgi:hypothetical protein
MWALKKFGQDVQFGLRIEGNVIPAVPDESSTLVIFNRGYRSARCADMETEFL